MSPLSQNLLGAGSPSPLPSRQGPPGLPGHLLLGQAPCPAVGLEALPRFLGFPSQGVKLARTIADLAGEASIAPAHLAEAIQYRQLDRVAAK
ncbi:MAG: hypothetical protein HYZ11_01665 [Candidatus Tectomicrobia bacterium]|uniref:Mg chelatase-related protein C-terminal domain-containing protein n=1 Tax=Tectimicrobiota bacterium TaxID=2528274 RepID=A0A932MM48_UNCTE|nr:hypothetical protein [Candidatus Tectomicrobia bacterium]